MKQIPGRDGWIEGDQGSAGIPNGEGMGVIDGWEVITEDWSIVE